MTLEDARRYNETASPAVRRRSHSDRLAPLNGTSIEISVVVPSYNGAGTIADCLRSIELATRARAAEIIVVDSSTDSTPEIVRSGFPAVRLIRSETRLSAGGARNRGAETARGRLVFFTDQDCVVPPDWIDRIVNHFRDPTVHAVGGAVAIRNPGNASACALYFLEFLYHFPGAGPPLRDRRFLVGCNCALRPDVIREVRFPDQTLGEDVLFDHRLRAAGFHTVYDPTIEVANHVRQGWGVFFRYNHRMGRAAAFYQSVLGLPWTRPFLRYPTLAFLAPLAIVPSIGLALLRSRSEYLLRFLLLSPVCFVGNVCWAAGFRHQARRMLADETIDRQDRLREGST